MNVLLVALAGAIGAPARYLVDVAVQRRIAQPFPWGTFVINASGSFLLGLLSGLALPTQAALLIGTGFCGAYTTFSTFSFESVRLMEEGAGLGALANLAGSVAAGLAAAAAGLGLGLL